MKKKKHRQKKNRGKLILDAAVAPADIKYHTGIDLLNKSREHLEIAVGIVWKEVPHTGHKLPYPAKKARRSHLKLAKSKKWTRAKCRKAIGEQLAYIELAARQLNKFAALVSNCEALFPRWLRDRLAVIPTVYRQQKEMYDNHSHSREDRTVRLGQPRVRPISVENVLKMIGNAGSFRLRLHTARLAGSTEACVGFVRDNIGGLYVSNTI